MPGVKVSDPSRLHLKKELTQIRKAARFFRDPGTVSSWKSPLSSSRSAAMAVSDLGRRQFEDEEGGDRDRSGNESHLESRVKGGHGGGNMSSGKEKMVFLYNWRTHKSSSERSGMGGNGGDEVDENESCSIQESLDDSLSDARNVSEMRRGIEPRISSMIFRCRDAGLVSPARRRANAARRKGKKSGTRLDVLSRYQQKEKNLRKLLKSHPSIGVALVKNGSLEQSDDTEEYSNSEDPGTGKVSAASSLLLLSKQKNLLHSASKLLRRSGRREESSHSYGTPPLSASSYNRYLEGYQSAAGSWDATTASFIDDYDDEEGDEQLDFPGSRGCGIPCYWSRRTPRHRDGCGSCCSSSISDTLRMKRGNILRGNRTIARARQHSSYKIASESARGLLPLLTDVTGNRGGSSLGTGYSDDETSTNFGELDLEASSQLDGRRWSSCRSQDGLEIVPLNKDGEEEEGMPENIRSLSQKYKPFFFDELIGQNIVVQSLVNAILRRRIAPVYLFQGPRGTGKTSTARIFASALNCRSDEETKPCGRCRECTDVISGKGKYIWEIDGTRKKEIDKVRYLFKKVVQASPSSSSHYTVFIIDECHLLPSRTWLAFLKLFEELMQQVVFIFVTTDIDNVPRTVQSQCQRYIFNKIKEGDAVARLHQIANKENLDVDMDALDLIALNADGSLRDAETMLDQLSLLGKRITTPLVNELLGVVPDEKLFELLELAMSSDTSETVKQARDLMDSGVDPLVLMSQMAGLVMDIIAGMHAVQSDTFFGGRIPSKAEVERLKRVLKLLLEAEKQLRVSNDRSTWFTAALLQLSSVPLLEVTQSSSSRRLSSRSTEEDHSSTSREGSSHRQKFDAQYFVRRSSSPVSLHNSKGPQMQLAIRHASSTSRDGDRIASMLRSGNLKIFNDLWEKCIEKCQSKTLRQLLRAHGNLLSVSKAKGVFVAYVAFSNTEVKARAERFLSSITNSIETVLRKNVEVRIVCVSDGDCSMSNIDLQGQAVNSRSSKPLDRTSRPAAVSGLLPDGNNGEEVNQEEIPMQRIESIIREQRLESAWLQAAGKGTPRSANRLKPEKNQIMPQEDMSSNNQIESPTPTRIPSQLWEDELSHELRVLTTQGQKVLSKNQNAKHFAHLISPSLLHSTSFAENSMKENLQVNLGYESSSAAGGCSSFLCWNSNSFRKAKVRRTPVHPARSKGGHFHIFGKSRRHKRTRSRSLKQT